MRMFRPIKALSPRLNTAAVGSLLSVRWRYRPPLTPREIEEMKRREELSMNWAKPILQYEKEKSQKSEKKEPHMIHVVSRIKTLKGRPWWEKDVCKEFGIFDKMHNPVPLKNTPGVNKKLAAVKHLVEIKPLTFPHGIPEHESDFNHLVLKSDGSLEVKKRLKDFDDFVEETPENPREKYQMKPETLKAHLDEMKSDYRIYEEYFKAEYVYEYNQDGKEYRYTKYPYTVKKET